MNTTLIVAAVVLPTMTIASTAGVKVVGRWFGKALRASMEDAVTDIVKPHLQQLTDQLTVLRSDNARDHAEVSSRLNALEARVALVEARLTPPATED